MPSKIESVLLAIAPTDPLFRISKGFAVDADDEVVEDIALLPVDRMASCAGIGAVLVVHAGFIATAGPDTSLSRVVETPCIILSTFGRIHIGASKNIYIYLYNYYYTNNRLILYPNLQVMHRLLRLVRIHRVPRKASWLLRGALQ